MVTAANFQLGPQPPASPVKLNATAPNFTAQSYFPDQAPQAHRPPSAHAQATPNAIADSHVRLPPTNPSQIVAPTPLSARPTKFTEEWDVSQRGSSVVADGIASGAQPPAAYSSSVHDSAIPNFIPNVASNMQRSNSFSGSVTTADADPSNILLSRGNTLKKKSSLRRGGSLRRSSSRRSMKAGSVRSLALQSSSDQNELQSVFFCPVPTSGNPTEALANRFQAWRKILKDLITYFREIQAHYEHRSKSTLKLANVLNNVSMPPGFLQSGGLDDALQILRVYNKQAVLEANKAREIEDDVILALTGLRSDLQQKIKEIKGLSGDFKNTVEKEMDATRRAVQQLQDVLGQSELDTSMATGKQDPYLLRLAVDRQIERQIDEENYLHQAYLNLENSGRELEAIVVGEIQKSHNAYAGILKREADAAYTAIEELRIGPIAMPKDHEWSAFVRKDDQFVDPNTPIRSADFLQYPGKDHYASQEIRAGLLERKSKYLRSYTAGWYVLSPTHLHEFKSADKTQGPVMSLYLPEQKLGSHSVEGGSSNKFILKGRQTGTMHRGHTWVFRAESHDTMMAWYEDIKALTEQSPEERTNFVRGHSRSLSRASQRSVSSDGVVDDEDDEPFSAAASISQQPKQDVLPRRPEPGGRFPSDVQVNAERGLHAPLSPISVSSVLSDHDRLEHMGLHQPQLTSAAALASASGDGREQQPYWQQPGPDRENPSVASESVGGPLSADDPRQLSGYGNTSRTRIDQVSSHAAAVSDGAKEEGINPYTNESFDHVQDDNDQSRASNSVGTRAPYDHGRPDAFMGEGGWMGSKQSSIAVLHEPSQASVASTSDLDSLPASSAELLPAKDVANPHFRRPDVGLRNDSVPTISGLHIPGEYPRGTPAV